MDVTLQEWIGICKPWVPETFSIGDHILDRDLESHASGWGPAVGVLTDPNGTTLTATWYDDGTSETIPRSNCRRTLNKGDTFHHQFGGEKVKMRVRRYTGDGRVVSSEFSAVDAAEVGRRTTRRTKRKDPDGNSAENSDGKPKQPQLASGENSQEKSKQQELASGENSDEKTTQQDLTSVENSDEKSKQQELASAENSEDSDWEPECPCASCN